VFHHTTNTPFAVDQNIQKVPTKVSPQISKDGNAERLENHDSPGKTRTSAALLNGKIVRIEKAAFLDHKNVKRKFVHFGNLTWANANLLVCASKPLIFSHY